MHFLYAALVSGLLQNLAMNERKTATSRTLEAIREHRAKSILALTTVLFEKSKQQTTMPIFALMVYVDY